MSASYPRAVACGDCGLSIEFGDRIDEAINARVLALDRRLADARPPGVIETVPTYRSLMIHYDPVVTSFEALSDKALSLAAADEAGVARGRMLRIPVCYEGEFGIDLADVAQRLGLTAEEVVQRHTRSIYRVYMLGFQPGFAYLGGLDSSLSLPRRAHPRFGAPAGTISIAAGQCAVHAVEGPSGWHWIGRTPVRTYRAGDPPRSAIEPGDRIRFVPVTGEAWRALDREAARGADLVEVEN